MTSTDIIALLAPYIATNYMTVTASTDHYIAIDYRDERDEQTSMLITLNDDGTATVTELYADGMVSTDTMTIHSLKEEIEDVAGNTRYMTPAP